MTEIEHKLLEVHLLLGETTINQIDIDVKLKLAKKVKEAIEVIRCCDKLKCKTTQTFDEFITGVYKNRGITLINNYTKETVGLNTLIEKWKATNM